MSKPPPAGAFTVKTPKVIARVNREIQRRPFLAKTFACAAGFAFGAAVVGFPVRAELKHLSTSKAKMCSLTCTQVIFCAKRPVFRTCR